MVIFYSYVELPEGSHRFFRGPHILGMDGLFRKRHGSTMVNGPRNPKDPTEVWCWIILKRPRGLIMCI